MCEAPLEFVCGLNTGRAEKGSSVEYALLVVDVILLMGTLMVTRLRIQKDTIVTRNGTM
jgi:hypothetical protein